MPDRLSLKWIDGNDVISSGNVSSSLYGQAVTPTFNVDQPNMWPPLSVLSGLASGFCERRAVLNDAFVVGTTTYTSGAVTITEDVVLNWSTDEATRANITQYCMNNMAMGSSVASLYNSDTEPALYPPGSAAASNYMTTMDAAITTLIGTSLGFVSSAGSASGTPYQFSTLAAKATSAASAGGSTVTMPVSNGGDSLKAVMYPALPVEWAKERKWMLDQLRYATGAQARNIISALSGYALVGPSKFISLNSGNRLTVTSMVSTYKNAAVTSADMRDSDEYPTNIPNIYFYRDAPIGNSVNEQRSAYVTLEDAVYRFRAKTDGYTPAKVTVYFDSPIKRTAGVGNGLWEQAANDSSARAKVITVVDNYQQRVQNSNFIIRSGGTLNCYSGSQTADVYTADVSSGGCIVPNAQTHVGVINLMSGGSIDLSADSQTILGGVLVDYKNGLIWEAPSITHSNTVSHIKGDQATSITTGGYYLIGKTSGASGYPLVEVNNADAKAMILAGDVSVKACQALDVTAGANATIVSDCLELTVHAGGTCSIQAGATVSTLRVMSGGTCFITSGDLMPIFQMQYEQGGVVSFVSTTDVTNAISASIEHYIFNPLNMKLPNGADIVKGWNEIPVTITDEADHIGNVWPTCDITKPPEVGIIVSGTTYMQNNAVKGHPSGGSEYFGWTSGNTSKYTTTLSPSAGAAVYNSVGGAQTGSVTAVVSEAIYNQLSSVTLVDLDGGTVAPWLASCAKRSINAVSTIVGIQPTAVNRSISPENTAIVDWYPTFYVRQSATAEEVSSAFPT